MAASSDAQRCVERWQAGDEKAATELYYRYLEQLVGVAQQRLSAKLSARLDAEDIVQSVFRSFFVRAQQGKFVFKDDDDIWKLLVQITIHKSLKQVAYHRRAKRDAGAEESAGAGDQDRIVSYLSREPTPEEAAIFMDELEFFLRELRPADRRIIEMRLEGYDQVEIAKRLGISDRTIRRLMERIRSLAERERPQWQ
ncbi:MAG: sigma-70 family RNA polymerase sigma factor [Gemmataceae bacterium]|nr:sigma-70 family RNA polymerase sigma factor [Gemmataceae bacterium]